MFEIQNVPFFPGTETSLQTALDRTQKGRPPTSSKSTFGGACSNVSLNILPANIWQPESVHISNMQKKRHLFANSTSLKKTKQTQKQIDKEIKEPSKQAAK